MSIPDFWEVKLHLEAPHLEGILDTRGGPKVSLPTTS